MTLALDLAQAEAHLNARLPGYLDLLRRMVAINSFTANPAGVNALGELTAEVFAGLGFRAEFIQAVDPAYGRHLVLTRPGQGGPLIGMVSHLDTVFPPEEELRNDFVWREEDGRVYGPGTVDIKGGTVMILMVLEALRDLAPAAFERSGWTVLINAAEERLAPDFGTLLLERLAGARACLVFEAGRMRDGVFSLVASRKGRAELRVAAEGHGAHAGSEHQRGANAIVQLARAVEEVAALTDYDRKLTVNVGAIRGGTVTNRVPHQAELELELRAFDQDVFEQAVAAVLALDGRSDVRSGDGQRACRLRAELESRSPPWPNNPATDALIAIWTEAGQQLGLRAQPEQRGGLSDGNWTWAHIPTLDGLGPDGGNAHASERNPTEGKLPEFALVSSFVPRALLNLLGVLRLVEGV
ncbi:MAG: M20 family metallopeptidase [Roseiflexaceae bacterium]